MRLQKTVSILSADTSDVARLTPKQLVKLLPYTAQHEEFYGPAKDGGAYTMYADMYGEQAYEMRANGMNPGTFKQWLLRQLVWARHNEAGR